MPTTLTLENVPDDVYDRLKAAAQVHRRSLDSEATVCLEIVLAPTRTSALERLERAGTLRAVSIATKFHARDIDDLKRTGRA